VVDEVEGAIREALGAGAIAAKMQAIVFEAYLNASPFGPMASTCTL
jgi:hypothetical protein